MVVGVYGCGRFGSLWARILSERHEVIAVDPYKNTGGEEQEPPLQPVNALSSCELVFLCVPISAIGRAVQEIHAHIGPRCIVADTCSVKEYPLRRLEELLPASTAIIGTHPLFGPDSYASDHALHIVLCRYRATDTEFRIFKSCLDMFSFVLDEMSPNEHDTLMAHTQCITHLVGRILGKQLLPKNDHTTKGYHALLELVQQTDNDTEELFFDMHMYNPYTTNVRKQFLQATADIIQLIDIKQKSILQLQDGETKKTR